MTEEIKYNKDEKWVPYKQLAETPQQTITRLEQDSKQLTQWLDEARRNADFWCDKCTSLEQENEKLKEANKKMYQSMHKEICEYDEELGIEKASHESDLETLDTYRSALEEIRKQCTTHQNTVMFADKVLIDIIINKINEVLNDRRKRKDYKCF